MPKSQRTAKTSSRSPVQPRFAIAIMAAGKGTRLKSKHPKVLHQIGGRPLLAHVIRAASAVVPVTDIFCIIGHEAEKVREAVASYGVNFVEQPEQRGTGHAIMQCRNALRGYDHVLVLSGDVPLISTDTISRVRNFHLAQAAAMTILTAVPADPFGYGRIVRKRKSGKVSDEVAEIVEQKSASATQQKIREINSGIYAFSVPELFSRIDALSTDNAHHEFYLTDMAALLTRDRKKVVALPATDSNEVLGVNTRLELASLDALLRAEKARQLIADGVTVYRPETCVFDSEVTVAPDTIIEPFVQLLGNTTIGADTVVRSYSVVRSCRIGNSVTIRNGCIMEDAIIEDGAIIGPYSHLRPASHIGENAHVGNFVETKKVRLGRGSKANHLTYLGDAEIGDGVNIGAGTITCNYDGVNKHQTTISDGAFIGSDATLVAPVKVGRGAYVAAGSCITDEVPEDSLALGRGRQVNKEGWAKTRRESLKKTAGH